MTCTECGAALDPTVTHDQHQPGCGRLSIDGLGAWILEGCDCPEVCADCCTDPDCPLRELQETNDG